jgi:hypothetical protein
MTKSGVTKDSRQPAAGFTLGAEALRLVQLWRQPLLCPRWHSASRKGNDMKKSKDRLREKIRSKPKGRRPSKRKNKARAAMPRPEEFKRPHTQHDDEEMEVMSRVILDFAAPLLETCNDEASERKAISLAIYVWNTALLPEEECRRTLDACLGKYQKVMPPEEFKTLSGYIDQLLQTRKTRFAHNRKKITNCTFGDSGDDRHIEVGYTME